MKIRVYYCRHCGWVAKENLANAASPNQCPDCERPGLWFIGGDDTAPIARRLRELNLEWPKWLKDIQYAARTRLHKGLPSEPDDLEEFA